ncbi:hypothetical protein HDU97_008267 [Phlyctochytrium planicorne]|nr:hypothetical protein HDU97_008267 [Phlyctochytrium planicorne]
MHRAFSLSARDTSDMTTALLSETFVPEGAQHPEERERINTDTYDDASTGTLVRHHSNLPASSETDLVEISIGKDKKGNDHDESSSDSTITIIQETKEESLTTSSNPKTSKLIYFEGLRGLAALQVFFIHTLGYFKRLDNLIRLYQHWSSAVPIFFILSGGIITRSILQSNADKKASPSKLLEKLFSSFVRRPFRFILPLYFACFYRIILILHFGLKQEPGRELPESVKVFFRDPVRYLIYKIPATQPFFPVPAWTLHPEMMGSLIIYLVTAVLLPFSENPRIRYTVLGTMFLFCFYSDNWAFYFLIGYIISDMNVSGYTAKFNKWRYSLVVKIMMLIVSCGITYEFSDRATPGDQEVQHPNPIRAQLMGWFGEENKIHFERGWGFPEHSIMVFYCTTVFFLIETTPFLQRMLSISPIAYLGRISFMLYLLHQDTAIALRPTTDQWLILTPDGTDYELKGCIKRFLLEMTVCILVADLSTRLFDEPVQKVVRRMERLILHDRWYLLPISEWPSFLGRKAIEFRNFLGERCVGAQKAFLGTFKRKQS